MTQYETINWKPVGEVDAFSQNLSSKINATIQVQPSSQTRLLTYAHRSHSAGEKTNRKKKGLLIYSRTNSFKDLYLKRLMDIRPNKENKLLLFRTHAQSRSLFSLAVGTLHSNTAI